MAIGVKTFEEALRRYFSGAVSQASDGVPLSFGTTTTLTTASALTLTAAQVAGGRIHRDPNGAGRSDTLPTATLLFAHYSKTGLRPRIGQRFKFTIKNTADAAETITILAGTGGTVVGTATIAQNNQKEFEIEFTSETTYNAYSNGSIAF